jgi:outer membrane protein assembly factor BamB
MVLLAGCDWSTFHFSSSRTGFNSVERTIGTGNVASLHLAFTGATGALIGYSSPAVADGVVFVASEDKKLYAFSADGTTGCSGTACQPLWTSVAASDIIVSSPTVANGFVYVGSHDHHLYVFDAAGSAGCSGAPKVCKPVWTADVSPGGITGSPLVAAGVVYASTGADTLFAFDASGATNCSGDPKTCLPLWTAVGGGGAIVSASLWNSTLYVPSSDRTVHAYDASGVANCGGMPKSCQPLWTTTPAGDSLSGAVSIANGMAYVGSMDNNVYAFDARGQLRCSTGTPKTCQPLWFAQTGNAVMATSAAVANGTVYIGSEDGALHAYDAAGNIGCSGGPPKLCLDEWTGVGNNDVIISSPAVANGVVYVGGFDGAMRAYDASGSLSCSDSPKTCQPLWTFATGGPIASSPAVVNSMVYVGSEDGKLYAFSL